MKKLISLISLMALFFVACSDDDSFSTSRNDVLSFSVDTLSMDTLFSGVPSSTKSFWVYNRNSEGLRLAKVRLKRGYQSGFRVNVDGCFLDNSNGSQIGGLELRKKDSLRVFVELTSRPNGGEIPMLVEDELVFTLESGVEQVVNLRAWSWDALMHRALRVRRDTVIQSSKPIIIFDSLRVDSGVTLTIKAPTTLYFHRNASLQVYGTLLVCSDDTSSDVVMRGDRTDRMFDYLPYDRTPGQWQGIRLREASADNELKYTDLHSAYHGIVVDSCDLAIQKLLVENSTIHNCQGYGLAISYAKVQVYNTQISNTLNHCLYVEGGHVDVNNSTIAQFYPFDGNRRSAIGFKAPIDTLDVRNSLVTGYGNDEVLWTPVEEEPLKFCFDHCVLRTEKMMTEDSLRFTHVVYEDVKDTTMYGEKHFSVFDTENLIYDFHLSAKSAAIGAADPKTALPYDRNGLKREEDKADAGCFLYRDEKKEE